MSFNKNKSKQSSTQTSTQALDPDIKSALLTNYQNAQALPSFTPYTGQQVADFSPTQILAQQQALDLAGQHVGSDILNSATQAAQTAAGYKPVQITGAGYSPTAALASLVNRGDVRDVSAGAVSPDAIANYQDPYEGAVVGTTLADIERNRQIEQAQNKAAALKSNAFGGTGAAVAANLTDDTFARTAASTAAGLRSQGYAQALAAAQADAGRRLQADTSNQNADLTIAGHNADLGTQNNQFNATSANDAARFGATQDLTARTANQAAAAQAAQFGLSGASLLAQIADQARNAALGDVNLTAEVGGQQQEHQQSVLDALYQEFLRAQNDPFKRQQIINQALGLAGDPTLTQSSGTSSGKSSGFGFDFRVPVSPGG